jgi:hypothetical protein
MKQKLHLKLQEKASKINDLRNMLANRMPQIVPVMSVDPLRTNQSKDTSEKRVKSRKSKRKDRSDQRSPARVEDEFQRMMLGTISDGKTNLSQVKKYP